MTFYYVLLAESKTTWAGILAFLNISKFDKTTQSAVNIISHLSNFFLTYRSLLASFFFSRSVAMGIYVCMYIFEVFNLASFNTVSELEGRTWPMTSVFE